MLTSSDLTVTDLFAGAGGSSTGAAFVPGVRVRVASNHWQLAVDVHGENHRGTDHICADIFQISPRYFPRTEMLWASPECTNHSRAKAARLTQDSQTCSGRPCRRKRPNGPGQRCGMWCGSASTMPTRT